MHNKYNNNNNNNDKYVFNANDLLFDLLISTTK